MRIAFCDDCQSDRDRLLEYAARYGREHGLSLEAREYADTEGLLDDPEVGLVTALFLDIYMVGANGVEAARTLRARGYNGAIVLCTSSRDHFADGFDIDASHYLTKPVGYEDFAEAMRRVLRLVGAAARTVQVRFGRDEIAVPVSHIRFAEVYNHETLLHLSDGAVPVGHSLSALEEILGGEPFLRCYRSYIINMDHVERMEDSAFVLKNGVRVPIARDGRKRIRHSYVSYLFSRMEGLV